MNQNVPVILVIEDDEAIPDIVEDALNEGGFGAAIATSDEEAVTLLLGRKAKYRALVTDINLLGRLGGWDRSESEGDRTGFSSRLYERGRADWTSKGVPNSIMLSKPFAPAQLLTAVSNLFNSGTPTA